MGTKPAPDGWRLVLDEDTISRCISRISYEIVERDRDLENLTIVGIRTNGEHLAERVKNKIEKIEGREIAYGVIDITLYRDDLSHSATQPTLKGTQLPRVTGSRIVLIDDVLYTGRTVRAALDAIVDFGRPSCVELAVVADRGHREYPIRPDYVGKNLPTAKEQFVRVLLSESDYKQDGVYIIDSEQGVGE